MQRTNLRDYYDSRVQSLSDDDLLAQVCHTLGGRPLPSETIDRMIADLTAALDLRPEDRLLDLCCGNGAMTRRLAEGVGSVVGVDFSAELIRVAKLHSAGTNAVYLQGDVMDLNRIAGLPDQAFTKVLLNTGLQHFQPKTFDALLDGILPRVAPGGVIVFAYVPERGKQRVFFNTPRKRFKGAWLRLTGQDVFGFWWVPQTIAATAERRGLTCSFPRIDPQTPYADYRFTARLACPPQSGETETAPR